MNFIYAYTYPTFLEFDYVQGFVRVKIGQTTRDAEVRIEEQQGTANPEQPVVIKVWNVEGITDKALHKKIRHLRKSEHLNGKGQEWFCIPVKSEQTAKADIVEFIETLLFDTNITFEEVPESVFSTITNHIPENIIGDSYEFIKKNLNRFDKVGKIGALVASGGASGYAGVSMAGLSAVGAMGHGMGIGASAGPVGAALGGLTALAGYGLYKILRDGSRNSAPETATPKPDCNLSEKTE